MAASTGAGRAMGTPELTLNPHTDGDGPRRFVVEEGHEAHADWITHIEAAIVAASGGGDGAASPPPSPLVASTHTPAATPEEAERRARAEAAAKAAADAKSSREAEEAAERAADAEDAANAAAEAAAAAAAAPGTGRGGAPAAAVPTARPPALSAVVEEPLDLARQPPSSPPPRPQLSNDPDASGAPPSHGIDPAAIAAAQALIRSPSDAPDTLVGWMHKSDPHGRNWKYRYFVLHGTVLSYYTDATRAQVRAAAAEDGGEGGAESSACGGVGEWRRARHSLRPEWRGPAPLLPLSPPLPLPTSPLPSSPPPAAQGLHHPHCRHIRRPEPRPRRKREGRRGGERESRQQQQQQQPPSLHLSPPSPGHDGPGPPSPHRVPHRVPALHRAARGAARLLLQEGRVDTRTGIPHLPPPQDSYDAHPEQVSWAGRAYWMACESADEAVDWAETLNVRGAAAEAHSYYPCL